MVKKKAVQISRVALKRRKQQHELVVSKADTPVPSSVINSVRVKNEDAQVVTRAVSFRGSSPITLRLDGSYELLAARKKTKLEAMSRLDVVKATHQESIAALRLLLWKLEFDTSGRAEQMVQGTASRAEQLFTLLDGAEMDLDKLKELSPEKLVKLFSRLQIRPTERIWLSAILQNRPCGAIILSQDGKHVCLRQAAPGRLRCSEATHSLKPLHGGANEPVWSNQGLVPWDGCPRDVLRQYYGRSIFPVHDVYDEHPLQEFVTEKMGPGHDIDSLGPSLEYMVFMKHIEDKHKRLNPESDGVVGTEEDHQTAVMAWSHVLGSDKKELMAEAERQRQKPLTSAARVYDVTLIRCEFDKGRPGAYRKKVENRHEEWARWLSQLQRSLHEVIEKCDANGTIQPLQPPSLDVLQAAVDRSELGSSHRLTTPRPVMESEKPNNEIPAYSLFRAVDPSQAVSAEDSLPCMPTIVVQGRIVLKEPSADNSPLQQGGSLALDLNVVVHSEPCFVRPAAFPTWVSQQLARLPLPPAMIPFNAILRADPLDFLLHNAAHRSHQPRRMLIDQGEKYQVAASLA
ncbi:hypothetical protein DIPPA_70113 [Diplonema papillatum]|nr:hypothetical protein DIPPA_70113 [Diplonema papillatum]